MQQQDEQPEIEVLPVHTRTPSNDEGGRAVQRGGQNIIIGTLNVMADPARGAFVEPLQRRYFRYYQKDRPHGTRHMIADVLMFLAVVGLVGYNLALYIGFGRSLLAGVQFSMTRSTELVSGKAVTYTLIYTNDNKEDLHDAAITLRIPRSLTNITVEPTDGFNTKTNTWKLGILSAGATAELTVHGRVMGEPQEIVTVSAILSYTPDGGRRAEQTLAIDQGVLAGSAFSMITTVPKSVVNQQSLTVTLHYANYGAFPLEHLVLQPMFPSGFTVEHTEPAMKQGEFVLDTIVPDGEGSVTISGKIDGQGQEQMTIPVHAVLRTDARDVHQGESVFVIPVFYPKFQAVLTIDMASIHSGEPTTYVVGYTNAENKDVLDANVEITFPKAFLNEGTFVSDSGVLDGTTVRFTKKTLPALALVKPKGNGSVTFTVASRATIDQRILFPSGITTLALPVTASYRMEPDIDTRIPNTAIANIPVGAALALRSFARYYTDEGEQLGRGPIPPVIGKTTRYWIFWNVVNQVNEVNAVVVRGVLPTGVAWTGRMSTTYGDAVKFDPATNTVLWNIDTVKRETGGIYPDIGASFEVAVTPEAAQIGKEALLVSQQTIQGVDSVTKETIEKSTADITTTLLHDPLAKGKGNVRTP